jgi:hypothetical protein
MNETSKNADAGARPPQCPICGQPLLKKGKIVDVGGFKKWIDFWNCSMHGQVLPTEEEPAES